MPLRNLKQSLAYFLQLCNAISHLHRQNLVYGLFSLENILIDHEKKAQLGIRHLYEANRCSKLQIQEDFTQSQAYMAPEGYFSKAGDVWSLTVLLHQIVTGYFPFNRENGMLQIVESQIEPQLLNIIRSGLRREPLQRLKLDEIIREVLKVFDQDLLSSVASYLQHLPIVDPQLPEQCTSKQQLYDITVSSIGRPQDEISLTKVSMNTELNHLQNQIDKFPQEHQKYLEISIASHSRGPQDQRTINYLNPNQSSRQLTPDFKRNLIIYGQSPKHSRDSFTSRTTNKPNSNTTTIKLLTPINQAVRVKAVRNLKSNTHSYTSSTNTKVREFNTSECMTPPMPQRKQINDYQYMPSQFEVTQCSPTKSSEGVKLQQMFQCMNAQSHMINLSKLQ